MAIKLDYNTLLSYCDDEIAIVVGDDGVSIQTADGTVLVEFDNPDKNGDDQ